MKIALLLSGLQRNFKPFIKNQIECLIKKYNCDLFIYTSNENNNRYISDGVIGYKQNKIFNNDENFFYSRYNNYLKLIYIDYNNKNFNEFLNNYDISKTKNFHINLISSYFKVRNCIKLMYDYEQNNNIKYDIVIRARLDFFVNNNFANYNLLEFDLKNNIYGSQFRCGHKDDCFFIMDRKYINIFYDFIFHLLEIRVSDNNIWVEKELIDKIEKYTNLIFLKNFGERIGSNTPLKNIPFFNKDNLNLLYSIEYLHTLKW